MEHRNTLCQCCAELFNVAAVGRPAYLYLPFALYKFRRKKLLAFGIMRFHTSVNVSLASYPEVCVVHWQLKLIAVD